LGVLYSSVARPYTSESKLAVQLTNKLNVIPVMLLDISTLYISQYSLY
jgi:hypothetical protein